MERAPLVKLKRKNLRAIRSRPGSARSAQVQRSCQKKLWITAISTAKAVAGIYPH